MIHEISQQHLNKVGVYSDHKISLTLPRLHVSSQTRKRGVAMKNVWQKRLCAIENLWEGKPLFLL
jgi:hypothetical protein